MTRYFCIAITCLLWCATAVAQNGADIFNSNCAACHGRDASSRTAAAQKLGKLPDLRSKRVQAKTDDELLESIGQGKDHVLYPHIFYAKGLTAADIKAVIKHLRTLAVEQRKQ